jgi:hypothetical protein
MNKPPVRLRDGQGPARVLMRGSGLNVPSAARRRALTFTGVAAGMAASGTAAAAGATSLVKGVVLYVCLGTVGGGVLSLGVSEAFSRAEARAVPAKPAQMVKSAAPRIAPVAAAPKVDEPVANAVPAPVSSALPEPLPARREPVAFAPAAAPARQGSVPAAASAKRAPAPSLFEEQGIIESARAALARGDSASALSTLDGYDRAHAERQFGPEALALRIEALSSRGELVRARSLAIEFRQRYPHHPLLSRVQAAVAR